VVTNPTRERGSMRQRRNWQGCGELTRKKKKIKAGETTAMQKRLFGLAEKKGTERKNRGDRATPNWGGKS